MSAISAKSDNQRLAEVASRLGHQFDDLDLLRRALTHMSAVSAGDTHGHYQRLEFQGDRVLALVVTDMLMVAFPDAREGDLARRLTALVRKETCVEVALELELGGALYLGAGEANAGGRNKKAILGDACEAVIAAIYRDGGFAAAERFIQNHWRSKMERYDKAIRDSKTALQEWSQSEGRNLPLYEMVKRSGPDHDPEFVVEVRVEGLDPSRASGGSKRSAEHAAARRMLLREGVTED